ncbi:MAG: 1-acyl-sn-glycerol-3-phosphate acyltransferase [Polyangiales bacterium]|nr:1-acyl-sn-glycerol-3-phosphate acyltransferase [Myxococcales bacterium]
MDYAIRREVADRLERLEIPFNRDGIDPYGIDRSHVDLFFCMLGWFQKRYFRFSAHGIEHIPARGRAMLVGNHSGGFATDAGMIISSCFFLKEPPRLAQGMAEKFINKLPFASQWTNKAGQFTGLPEHAERLLEDGRLLVVFPEGAKGTAKLFHERHSLVRFGTGFMRLALRTKSPVIPFGFAGAGDALPTVMNLYKLGKLFGLPYIPVTPYIVPVPLPATLRVHYGEPMHFEGTGNEDDLVIHGMVEQVRERIAQLMDDALKSEGTSAR